MKQVLVLYMVIISVFVPVSGVEIQVNTRPACDQTYADIATDANGNFVVVWTSYYSSGDKSNEIRGRRFTADGSPIDATEFEINTTEAGNQKEPSVAMDEEGNFVVVWQGPDQNQNDIFAQRFDANGQKINSEFRVNSNTADEQFCPSVAMNDSGNFVVVWESNNIPETGKRAICAQSYDGSGQPLGNEIRVDDINSVCRYPDVVLTNSGTAIVVWLKDSATKEVYKRSFQADGTLPLYNSSKVNESPNLTSLTRPSVSVDSAGNYVIAWDGHSQGEDYDNIYLKRYQWSNAPLHEQYLVNTQQTADQTNPSVAMCDATFIVVWEDDSESEGTERNILGQRFVNQGEETGPPISLGDEFQLNIYEVDDQKYPDAAIKENGEFIAVWQSSEQDGSGYGIFGRTKSIIGSADFTGDGFVNFHDYCILAEEWPKLENPLTADLFDDNKINEHDLAAFCEQWLKPRYECNEVDIHNDGRIDFKDYSSLTNRWLNKGVSDADVTGNGTVDWADLKAVAIHWAKTCKQ